ncbi:hypothetical protein scyTo_0019891, partial [Scyliorhinus torazame]|nr:hypothetical protein [Scyliorhinus torazame]
GKKANQRRQRSGQWVGGEVSHTPSEGLSTPNKKLPGY